jgi:aminodeoxyfutalosine deaminase
VAYPKIELHVHLEATVQPDTLLRIAQRNGMSVADGTVAGLRERLRFRDFAHFIEVWIETARVLKTPADFREVVVSYAQQARQDGCVYIEGIFSPAEPVRRGASFDDVFSGYCDGAQEAFDRHGVIVRLTPDITRGFTLQEAEQVARYAVAYRERGVVGLGLGGHEAKYPPALYQRPFAIARAGGVAAVPHAGELAGAESVRGALDALHADRVRHGIRAVEDAGLVRELAGRGTVLDICLVSNLRTGVVASLETHPIVELVNAGVSCSLSTDDPVLFDTDLAREYAAAQRLGLDPRGLYNAGWRGALCDEQTRSQLIEIGERFDWSQLPV